MNASGRLESSLFFNFVLWFVIKEAQSINKSLSALGDVISALSSEQQFIPYRNNKLTMLMQDSLGKNFNRPFATKDHVVQNPPCWRASSLLFPHWDIKTKACQV